MNAQEVPVFLEIGSDAVARIVFNRPSTLNAISPELAQGFLDACLKIQLATGIRAVLIKGSGRAFMAGGDLSYFKNDFPNAPEIAESMIAPLNEAVVLLTSLPVPVIASVHGSVAGAGLSLAMAVDFVIADSKTKFSFAYSKIGASPDVGGAWLLPKIVGLRRALEIAILAEPLNAVEAYRIGIVNFIAHDNLDSMTEEIILKLANGPTVAFGQSKLLLRKSYDTTLESHLIEELEAFKHCAETKDFSIGVNAFFDRINPIFSGN